MRTGVLKVSRASLAVAAMAAMGAGAVGVASPASAATLSSVTINEGSGVGNYVTLGQSRTNLINTLNSLGTNNGNCNTASSCSFVLSPGTASVTATFNSSDTVSRIKVIQGGVALDKRWETSAGVVDGMIPSQVQALYAGSTIKEDLTGSHVVASNQGYTYNYVRRCYSGGCSTSTSHEIYAPGGGGGTVAQTANFSGAIQVYNSTRKTSLTLSVVVTDPNGAKKTITDTISVNPRSWVSVSPGAYLSKDGAKGTYSYTAQLKSGTRVVGSNSGTFKLVLS